MTNIMDYLKWRGDLPLEKISLCDVDYLVLCRVAYIKMAGIVPSSFSEEPMDLDKMAEAVVRQNLASKEDTALLKELRKCPRFQNLKLLGHVDIYDDDEQEQFSAVTVLLPDESMVIVYRGTDSTIIGWKEDFNMGFAENVPAQQDAAEYIAEAARMVGERSIRICGHSKGGNLAVYSAAFCPAQIQDRILEVRNFDGPGFNEKNIHYEGVRRISARTRTYLPQSSIVGMLLAHEEAFTIVHSKSIGIFQHDLYSWEIEGAGFVTETKTTGSSQFIDSTLKEWLSSMSAEKREAFINGVFALFDNCDAKTLRELWTGKNAVTILKTLVSIDESTRTVMLEGLSILKKSAKKSLTLMLDNNTKDG